MMESPEWMAYYLRNKTLICVTDGSYAKKKAREVYSVGWIITCKQMGRIISGTLVKKSQSADSTEGRCWEC